MNEEKMKENEKVFGIYLNCKTRNGNLNGFFNYDLSQVNCVNYFFEPKEKEEKKEKKEKEIKAYIGESKYNNKIICNKSFNSLKIKGIFLFSIFIKIINNENNNENNKFSIKYTYKPPKNVFKETINWDIFLWYVINSLDNPKLEEIKNEDYILGENDILKLGTYKYLISKIHIKGKEIKQREKFCDFSPPLKKVKKCEFCKKIMVSLCDCHEYFHVEEIKTWIKERYKKIIKNKTINYYFEIAKCEGNKNGENNNYDDNGFNHCNAYYPLNFKYDPRDLDSEEEEEGQEKSIEIKEGNNGEQNYIEVNLFDLEIPKDKDYMILESFPQKEAIPNSNKNVKSVHIVELTGGPIKIGRNEKNNDIILKDQTASSEHAIIEYKRSTGELIIKNLSKHAGTLALIYCENNNMKLGKTIFFQANRSLIEASVMRLSDYLNDKKNLNSEYPLNLEEKKE